MGDVKRRGSDRIAYLGAAPEKQLVDLSTTGACCYHTTRKERDWLVTVKISNVTVKARVVYCRQRGDGYRLGVQFQDVDEGTQAKIDEIVGKYSKGVPVECRILD